MVHELKTWPKYFDAILSGKKKFELRKNDRDFKPGQFLHLRRWLPDESRYSGEELVVFIHDVLKDFDGLEEGYCIMSLGDRI